MGRLGRATPTLAAFAALGLFWGAWASVLPSVQRATGASNGELGVALLFVTVGLLPAMLLVGGPVVDRYGGRAVALAAAAFAGAALLPGLATSVAALAAALVLTGATSGVMDVGINASAAWIETVRGRRLMPLAHGLYSTGVLVGAASAGLARGSGASRESILAAVAVAVFGSAVLLALDPSPLPAGTAQRRPKLERGLLAIGLVGAAAFVVEGATETWSALFLERQLDAEPAVSGLGPAVFGASMALGRFLGQAARASDRMLLAGGASLAACGCTVVALSPSAPAALAGLALGGLGISLNAPIVFGIAGRRGRNRAAAISTVTTIGYIGLLVGPPLMGGLAQVVSLRLSFAVLAGIAVLVSAAALRLRL